MSIEQVKIQNYLENATGERYWLDYLCVLRNELFVSEGHDIGDWAIRYEMLSNIGDW